MKYKKSMIIIMLAIFLFSIASASANEMDTPIASEDTGQMELTNEEIIEENLQTGEENPVLTLTDNEETVSAQNNTDILGDDSATYSDLAEEIGKSGNIQLKYKTYTYNNGDTITIHENNKIIDGNGAVIDMAGSTIRAFEVRASKVTFKNLTIKNANYNGEGSAILFVNEGTVTNCNFTDNEADYGGAIYFSWKGTVTNCNFVSNSASYGGAVKMNSGSVENCNFTNNTASDKGGAVFFYDNGTVTNCNFVNNTVSKNGGAINMGSGTVTNCNFTDNAASENGGAINMGSGTVTNCNFTDNHATKCGGAVYFNSNGTVTNCNFVGNKETDYYGGMGGAVYFVDNGKVTNCNFKDNCAGGYAGAILFDKSATVENCKFINNTATRYAGGAITFDEFGAILKIKNCSFINNTAMRGGGICIDDGGAEVSDCYFTGNTYNAIFFYSSYGSKTISNSVFLNNKAHADEYLETFCYSDNYMDITFRGNNNLINAIYSSGGVNFDNVTYWGVNGITNTGSSYIQPSNTRGEPGQNITIEIYDSDDNLVENVTLVTGENGKVKYDYIKLNNGNYKYKDYHQEDNYYTYTENSGQFNLNSDLGDFNRLQEYINGASQNSVLTLCRNYTFTIDKDENLEDGIVIDKQITIKGNGYTIDAKNLARIFKITGNDVVLENITFINGYSNNDGGAINMVSGTVLNCNFTNNSASIDGGAILMDSGTVSNCNFTNNKVTGENSEGGAIKMNSGNVAYCNFNDNTASKNGGAVYFDGEGTVSNCNFVNNSVKNYGGAVFVNDMCNVVNSNFTNNNANIGGAVYANNVPYGGVVINCNFINNSAEYSGGAVNFDGKGYVTYCNFINNTANSWDGALRMYDIATVTYCNFTGNSAKNTGALYLNSGGNVIYCNFNDNTASENYGAVFFMDIANLNHCKFFNNSAGQNGGAIYMDDDPTGNVINCSFIDNSAGHGGGAIYMIDNPTYTVINCSFTDNSAGHDGGAIYIDKEATGNVTNCNFTGNKADSGSAIYFYGFSSTGGLTISNSSFLNNRANAEALEVIKNDDNITIIFTGNDNLLNAIYSGDDVEVTFTNVTYWGANGINNTGSSEIKPSRSNKEAGQNITVSVVVNGIIVLNEVKVTDENGMIVLLIKTGENYFIGVRHDTDSYYTEANNTISNNTKFNVNVTSQTTHNKTVNITAESNIPNEFINGKLLFILPNGENVTANYAGNGTWWTIYEFADYGDYQVNASFDGLDNVTINNATISVTKPDAILIVDNVVMDYGDSVNVTVTTEGATGITAKIDGNNVTVNEFTITISGLNAGSHTLTVTTIADENHNPVTKNATITVNKLKTEIIASTITTTYNINKDLVVTLKDGNGEALAGVQVTVDLNGAKTYTTDSNGQVKVTTKGLAPKKYTAKITFNGNTKYDKSSKNVKVTVKKAKPKITAKKKTFKKTKKVKKFKIVLKNNVGKPIKKAKLTLKVKGKKYKAKTNSKGKATFKIKNLKKKGTYKAKIKYKGNKYYKKLTKKVKIKVIVKFKTVSKGSKDKATVKEIQQALKDHGYYLSFKGHYLKVDGKYKSCTVRSVKEFQHDKGLKVTGKVNEKTAKKLGIL